MTSRAQPAPWLPSRRLSPPGHRITPPGGARSRIGIWGGGASGACGAAGAAGVCGIVNAGVDAVRAKPLVENAARIEGDALVVDDHRWPRDQFDRLIVFGENAPDYLREMNSK